MLLHSSSEIMVSGLFSCYRYHTYRWLSRPLWRLGMASSATLQRLEKCAQMADDLIAKLNPTLLLLLGGYPDHCGD